MGDWRDMIVPLESPTESIEFGLIDFLSTWQQTGAVSHSAAEIHPDLLNCDYSLWTPVW